MGRRSNLLKVLRIGFPKFYFNPFLIAFAFFFLPVLCTTKGVGRRLVRRLLHLQLDYLALRHLQQVALAPPVDLVSVRMIFVHDCRCVVLDVVPQVSLLPPLPLLSHLPPATSFEQKGASTSTFGSPAPATGGIFGAPAPSTGLFGQPPVAAPPGQGGTKMIPFQATGRADGQSQITLHSITAMPQYEQKSFEELRLEDYSQGNRGTGTGTPTAAGGFGGFGSPAPAPATGGMYDCCDGSP